MNLPREPSGELEKKKEEKWGVIILTDDGPECTQRAEP